MNQILVTEKIYITPEIKRKKFIYKLEFFLSVFLICLLFSYYIYAEYDQSKSEQVSKELVENFEFDEDTTVKKAEDDDVIVVVLSKKEEQEHQEEVKNNEVSKIDENKNSSSSKNKESEYHISTDGVRYKSEAVLKVPAIGIEYTVLSATSPDLLFVSLNKFHGPEPNEIGNYCIVGHYYESGYMFGKLHKLKNGDTATLTDKSGRKVKYEVYDKYIVEPTDTKCTSQLLPLKNKTRELTLITCTNHGKQRLVVKLKEVR